MTVAQNRRSSRHPRGRALTLVLLACGCSDDKPATTATSASATASVSAARTSVPAAPSGMTVAGFCKAHDQMLDALLGRCDKAEAAELYAVVASGIQNSKRSCLALKDVKVVEKNVAACLSAVKTWHDASLTRMQYLPTCRRALEGLAADGAPCTLDLSCKAGSHCLPKPSADDLEHVCTPAPKVGSPCRVRAGHSCGPALDCVEATGKCVARGKAGDACGSGRATCAEGLTCLRNAHKDPTGKCGPRRKDSEGCHQWAECEGRCKTAAKTLLDGFCAPFCAAAP